MHKSPKYTQLDTAPVAAYSDMKSDGVLLLWTCFLVTLELAETQHVQQLRMNAALV